MSTPVYEAMNLANGYWLITSPLGSITAVADDQFGDYMHMYLRMGCDFTLLESSHLVSA